jgi:hypothetical protein
MHHTRPLDPPPEPWHRTKHGRRAIRAAGAAALGAGIGALCAVVPEEARELCRTLARLVSVAAGLG